MTFREGDSDYYLVVVKIHMIKHVYEQENSSNLRHENVKSDE